MTHLTILSSLALALSTLGAAPLAAQHCSSGETARPSVVEYHVNWRNPLHLDGIQADVLKISTGGGGQAVLRNIQVGRLELRAGGGSRIEVGGQADEVIARISGGSRYLGVDLQSPRVNLDASGGSRVDVRAEGRFEVNVSGSATVSYLGKPAQLTKHVSRSSTLKQIQPKPQRSPEELRRLESLQRTLSMRMTRAPQVARAH